MNHETRAALANLLIVALAAPAPAPAPAPAEPNKSINPDEAVSYGAAVQTAILSGDTSSKSTSAAAAAPPPPYLPLSLSPSSLLPSPSLLPPLCRRRRPRYVPFLQSATSYPQKYVTVLNPIWLQAEAEAEGLKTKAKPDFRWFGWFRRRQ
ncbi:unnamed protein product [Alternaria alternata]